MASSGIPLLLLLLLCWRFTALWHFSGHFGCGQLTYPHCSWASLQGSLPVLSAHSFASNWQLPFLNQWKGENGCRNYPMTNLHERMLPDVRIESTTVRIPGEHASDWATAPGGIPLTFPNDTGTNCWCGTSQKIHWCLMFSTAGIMKSCTLLK